jgi:hypothetical protein
MVTGGSAARLFLPAKLGYAQFAGFSASLRSAKNDKKMHATRKNDKCPCHSCEVA